MASIFNKSLQQYLHVRTGPMEPISRMNVLKAVVDILVVCFESLLLKLSSSFSSADVALAFFKEADLLALLINEL